MLEKKQTIHFFIHKNAFRNWLEINHKIEKEVLVGFYKKGSLKPILAWSDAVDQALCYGWIDGVVRTIDAESYCRRFTPRKKNSIWSTININKVYALQQQGLMTEAGLTAFNCRQTEKSGIYAHENESFEFSKNFLSLFEKEPQAWAFYRNQTPYYQKMTTYWVISAKREDTQLLRLNKLISASKQQEKIKI
ncbi:MAG: YdeI/OmpD-associated family protein [Alphaproteobacteria bacterium]|nr:YdeI/OmpD-associated family protein [Alphaproteobacteria bacterium]